MYLIAFQQTVFGSAAERNQPSLMHFDRVHSNSVCSILVKFDGPVVLLSKSDNAYLGMPMLICLLCHYRFSLCVPIKKMIEHSKINITNKWW